MKIVRIDTPWMDFGCVVDVTYAARTGSTMVCYGSSDGFWEKGKVKAVVRIEWVNEEYAKSFERNLQAGTAVIEMEQHEDGGLGETNGILMFLIVIGYTAAVYGSEKDWENAFAWLDEKGFPLDQMSFSHGVREGSHD